MRTLAFVLLMGAALSAAPEFQVKFPASAHPGPVDGRLILVVSKSTEREPRFEVSWGVNTAQIFGIDVDGWKPGEAARIDSSSPGHPIASLSDLPPGNYRVQAVLNVYETFHRGDGHTVKMHMDHGEGQHWESSPGNLFSKPKEVEIGSGAGAVEIELSEVIPPIPPPHDTKYIKHVTIESKLLTQFWGRPMSIGASVLVPEGFDEHPERRYPIAFLQSHFGGDFFMFRETPPTTGAQGGGRGMRGQATAYQFYQDWTSGRLPKMLLVVTNHATPIYDDSYGVNTANAGPYGDALTTELYPELEKRFHAIGAPWARVVFGGSTGGWMTLAQQIFYPDYFGGAWGFCPDPVDFHAFQSINLYSDSNAYWDQGPFARLPKLLGRLPNDHILSTMELFSKQEAVLGTRGRSGGQMDAFHATFGPTDADGYPARLWNSQTGEINPDLAKYWREHYDLTAKLEREWPTIGPKLVGKLHVTMGTKDTFYLDAAAHRMQDFLESTKLPGKGPYYGGSFEFGNNEPHCFVGTIPEGVPMLTFYTRAFADYIRKMAPAGADLESWR